MSDTIKPFLIEEPAPANSSAGTKAYRFTDRAWILYGAYRSIDVSEAGEIAFTLLGSSRGVLSRPQNTTDPVESHITVPAGGTVDPRLVRF